MVEGGIRRGWLPEQIGYGGGMRVKESFNSRGERRKRMAVVFNIVLNNNPMTIEVCKNNHGQKYSLLSLRKANS